LNKDSVSDLVANLVLPGLPEHRLRTLARLVGLEVPGFRAGKGPGGLLVSAIGKGIHQEQSILDRVTLWLGQENEDLSRLIASRKLADLKTGLPRLVEEHQLGPVLFCLLMDGRRGMAKLSADYLAVVRRTRPAAATWEEVAATSATAASAATAPAATAPARHRPAKHPGPPLKTPRNGERRLQAKVGRLEAQLAKVRADRDKVREEAGAAGGEVGVLRKQVRKLTEASAGAGGRAATGPPVIIEAKTVSEWESRLESTRRENDRLRGQLEQTDRENDRLASELRSETETAERLRQALERRMRVVARGIGPRPGAKGVTAASEAGRAAPADALVTALPFEYEGPDGSFRLRGSFRLVVPDSVVKRLGLVSGDLVTVTVTPDRRVELKVLIRAVSESVLGSVKRVAAEDGRGAWQVIGLDRQPLGWVSEAEFTARSLADGDAVTVTRAGRKEGDPPRGLWSPAVGLPALPRCRVLQKHEAPAAESLPAAPARHRAVGRAVAGEKPETGRYSGEMRAFARQRPLAGKKVLVVGGDSFNAGYRAIVESLGAEFEFQGAGRDMTMVKSRARAADIVVLVTGYLSHKVSGVVTDTMKGDGREPALCYAGSKGRGAILEALRPHFRAVNGGGAGTANSAGTAG